MGWTMKVDSRFLTAEGPEIFTGSELVLKGALETEGGVHLLGGYPGSPVAGFFDSMVDIKDLLNEKGIRAAINHNEALAAAMLNGTQTLPFRAMICMKSVGMHVAADGLALGNLAGAHPEGGAVVICGDDPWSDSTQVPADSRYIFRHLHMPFVEPSNAQEVKDSVDVAFKISRRSQTFLGYLLTTNLADGGGSVACKENQYPTYNTNTKFEIPTSEILVEQRTLLPPRTWSQEESLGRRHRQAMEVARELGINRIEHSSGNRKPIGFITSGLAHGYLVQVLFDLGLLGEYPILKFGMSYPMDPVLIEELASQCDRIVVVEERRGFMEEQAAEILLGLRQETPSLKTELWGKKFPGGLVGLPSTRGLHPSIVIERLVPLFKLINEENGPQSSLTAQTVETLDREIETLTQTAKAEMPGFPVRLPTFCPGCPHRDSASLCLEIKKHFMDPVYMKQIHKREAMDLLFHGDIGCYTMLMYPPNGALMRDLSGMGLGGGTGSGIDPFVTNKEVVFMGDSTFFHCGALAISQAIKLGQDITFIILDNSTTAMTGHQTTPELNFDVLGNPTDVQDLEDVVRGIASLTDTPIVRVNPEQRDEYRKLLEHTFLSDGVKVIIADKECAITRTRRRRRGERAIRKQLGYLPSQQHTNVNQDICKFCLACAELTGCTGLKHVETDYGLKIDTDVTWCVTDGACERIGACCSFEHITVKRKRPPKSKVPELHLDNIPEPVMPPLDDIWRCCLAGFGGMGIAMLTSIIIRAGHKEGYDVEFIDKKGLAIRNGGVVSQILFNFKNCPITAAIPYGKADVLLGIDVLEAAHVLNPGGRMRVASSDRTAAVINTDKIQTISGIMGREDFDVDQLEETIHRYTKSDDYMARNISRICEKYLGSKLYANTMMLGFAFQKGLIPVSMHSIAWAMKDSIKADFRKNMYAFNMGRKFVTDPDLFQGPPTRTGWRETLEDKLRWTIRRYRSGQERGRQLRELVCQTISKTNELSESLKRDIVIRAYDAMRWGGLEYAKKYTDAIIAIYDKDSSNHNFEATASVIKTLASAILTKDIFYIAELATSGEKMARDRVKYNVNPANGDRIIYRHMMHFNRRHRGKDKHVHFGLPSWVLKITKRMTWLRNILPGWNRKENTYLAAYMELIENFDPKSDSEYDRQLAVLQSPPCLKCINPLCKEDGCPLKNEIPDWIDLSNRDQWQEALDELHSTNNFPEFTGAICPAPCQTACKNAKNIYPLRIKDIERQIVERGFSEGWIRPQRAKDKTGKAVAIIGSGPAALATAQQLARKGHSVTVFEKDDKPGGLLRYGIPNFRLDKTLLDRRIKQLIAEDIVFETNKCVGLDISADEIRNDFDAVCIAAGAVSPRDLDIHGRNLTGIHFALDYLRQENLRNDAGLPGDMKEISAQGLNVVVIGGGDTGADCVDTAIKQGAATVTQLELLDKADVATNPTHKRDDKAQTRWSTIAKAFLGNHHVHAVTAVQVKWQRFCNKKEMSEIPRTNFDVPAEMVLLAVGFESHMDPTLTDAFDLALGANNLPRVEYCQTSQPGVFVAGDVATGPALVAGAIADGRKAAARIDEYLS